MSVWGKHRVLRLGSSLAGVTTDAHFKAGDTLLLQDNGPQLADPLEIPSPTPALHAGLNNRGNQRPLLPSKMARDYYFWYSPLSKPGVSFTTPA